MLRGIFIAVLICLFMPLSVMAHTFVEWTRNTEPDMDAYNVYMCKTKGCIVKQDATYFVVRIPQVAIGVKPSFHLPANTEGSIAVDAEDTSKNKSGLSVSVPFESIPPVVPSGLTLP